MHQTAAVHYHANKRKTQYLAVFVDFAGSDKVVNVNARSETKLAQLSI